MFWEPWNERWSRWKNSLTSQRCEWVSPLRPIYCYLLEHNCFLSHSEESSPLSSLRKTVESSIPWRCLLLLCGKALPPSFGLAPYQSWSIAPAVKRLPHEFCAAIVSFREKLLVALFRRPEFSAWAWRSHWSERNSSLWYLSYEDDASLRSSSAPDEFATVEPLFCDVGSRWDTRLLILLWWGLLMGSGFRQCHRYSKKCFLRIQICYN